MRYSAHWLATILAAIIFNIVSVFGFAYVLPQLTPAPKIENVTEFELIDVEFDDDIVILDEEPIPSDTQQETSPFNAQDLIVPEIVVPKPIEIPPLPETKPVEIPKPKKPSVENKPTEPPKQSEQPKPTEQPKQTESSQVKQLLTKPPVTIMAVYPDENSVLGFKGYISFAVHIGKDGKVKSTEILQSSGKDVVDEIARKAVEQWTFRPALDQFNRPMECDKIITFDFKGQGTRDTG